jgi:hypothetical protein
MKPGALQQVAHSIGAVDHVTFLHGLPGFSKGPQRLGVCPDLSRLPQSQVGLDGEHHGLVDTPVVFLGGQTELRFKTRIES